MSRISKISLGAAVAALTIGPVQAAELPHDSASTGHAGYQMNTILSDGADEAQNRHYRYRRHRDRIDAGDVIAGALVIGGIFAVASAVARNSRDDRDDRHDPSDRNYESNSAFDRAVDSCVERVEREQRIGSVDNVGRTRNGYSVSGTVYDGSNFSCDVSAAGRVLRVDYGHTGVTYQSGGYTYGDPQNPDRQYSDGQYSDGQYSDVTYARARADTYSTPDVNTDFARDRGAQPTYPGGPVPGEDYSGYADGEPY